MNASHVLLWVSHHGYAGLVVLLVLGIVGLPLPDETLLTAVGYLVYRGSLAYVPALIAGSAGAAGGITLSYMIGAWLGRPAVLRYGRAVGLNERRLQRTEDLVRRYGGAGLVVGFFLPGVRHMSAIAAGTCRMPPLRFAGAAYTGACLWVTTFITLGRFAGPHLALAGSRLLHGYLVAAGAMVALSTLLWIQWRRGRAPIAPPGARGRARRR